MKLIMQSKSCVKKLGTQVNEKGNRMKSLLIGLLSATLLLSFTKSEASTVLTATPSTGPAPLSVTLSWSSDGDSCIAGGGWSGEKPTSGEEIVVVSATTSFSLTCKSTRNTTSVTWTLPTERTDGTPLENLESTLVFHSLNTINEEIFFELPVPATSYVFNDLEEGNWVFALKAKDGYGLISVLSNVGSKTITHTEETAEASVVVLTPPKPPILVTVETVVYELRQNPVHGNQIWRPVGSIKLGTKCNPDFQIGDYYEVPVDSVYLRIQPRSLPVVAKCLSKNTLS
jgi:hypothetical protein